MVGVLIGAIIWILIISVLACILIDTYAKPETAWSVRGVVFTCWVMGFFVPYLIALDFYGAYPDLIHTVWKFSYTFALVACWVFVPLLQNYYDNGGFVFVDKIKDAIIHELYFYLIVIALAALLVMYMAFSGSFEISDLPSVIMILANTWGLSLIILMLGYGLVEVPRVIWYSADRNINEQAMYFKLNSIHEDSCVEQDKMQQTHAFVTMLDTEMDAEDPLREQLEIIKAILLHPSAYKFANITPSAPIEKNKRLNKLKKVHEKSGLKYKHFIDLHYLVILHNRAHRLMKAEWNDAVNTISWIHRLADLKTEFPSGKNLTSDLIPPPTPITYHPFPCAWLWPLFCRSRRTSPAVNNSGAIRSMESGTDLQDLEAVNNRSDMETDYASHSNSNSNSSATTNTTVKGSSSCMPQFITAYNYPIRPNSLYSKINLSWFKFLTYRQQLTMRIIAVIFTILSILVLWSELSIMIPENLSPIALALDHTSSALSTIVICLLPILYITGCTFYTLFRVRFSSFYHMHTRQRTGETSILHNAAFMLRLILPLAYNFFLIARGGDKTEFSKINGSYTAVPFFGGTLNVYMPAFIWLVSGLTFFNCFGYIFKWLNIPRFEYSSNSEASDLAVTEGQRLYQRDKRFKQMGSYDESRSRKGANGAYSGSGSSGPIYKTSKHREAYENRRAARGDNNTSIDHFGSHKSNYHSQRENTIKLDEF